MAPISTLVRAKIDAGTSAHALSRLSAGAISHQQFTNLANGEIRAWPKITTVEALARVLEIDTRAVILGYAVDLGLDVRENRSPLATRLPANTDQLTSDQVAVVAQLVRWLADEGDGAIVTPIDRAAPKTPRRTRSQAAYRPGQKPGPPEGGETTP